MSQNIDMNEREESVLEDQVISDELIDEVSEKNLELAVKKGFRTQSVKVSIRLVLAALLIASITVFVTGLMKYSELQREKQALEDKVNEYEAEVEKLEYLIDSPIDYNYIVRIAKEKLNLFLPDEIIYNNDTNN